MLTRDAFKIFISILSSTSSTNIKLICTYGIIIFLKVMKDHQNADYDRIQFHFGNNCIQSLYVTVRSPRKDKSKWDIINCYNINQQSFQSVFHLQLFITWCFSSLFSAPQLLTTEYNEADKQCTSTFRDEKNRKVSEEYSHCMHLLSQNVSKYTQAQGFTWYKLSSIFESKISVGSAKLLGRCKIATPQQSMMIVNNG